MTLDLNRCLIYGNPDGTFRKTKKRYYSVIDGVIAMEGAGPMQGDPKECGVYISGEDPASVDTVATTLMGLTGENYLWYMRLSQSMKCLYLKLTHKL